MSYRCGPAAIWLPRVLSVALVIATAMAGLHAGAFTGHLMATGLRMMIVMAGLAAAGWVVWRGSEVRQRVRIDDRGLALEGAGPAREVPFGKIDELDFAPPFRDRGAWLPALVVLDADGDRFRVTGLLTDGRRLVEEIVRRSGRSDLEAWASARNLAGRMGRGRWFVAICYLIAVALVVVAFSFLRPGP